MPWKPAPLNSSFLAAGMLGFLISVFYVSQFSMNYGAAFAFLFLLMIIASFVSMLKANPNEQLYPKRRSR